MNCIGCSACYNACQFEAIEMKQNAEGFLYPVLNNSKCVKCNKCYEVCPMDKEQKINENFIIYAGYDKEKKLVKNSSSGGLFSRFARYILKENGLVYGAGFEELELKHLEIDSLDNLIKISGSKYLQSDINMSYNKIRMVINCNKKILFSGTSCQIAGLKSYLKYFNLDDYKNLYTIAVICHGVPSIKIFNDYINFLEKKYNSKVNGINFRDKINGWENYYTTIYFDNGKKQVKKAAHNRYMIGFLRNYYLRKSCYDCKFKGTLKDIDIILGDAWGIKKIYPDIYNKNGTSVMIINSEKGQNLYSKISKCFKLKKIDYSFIKKYNSCVYKPVKGQKQRAKFFEDYNLNGFEYVYKKFMKR